MFESYRDKFVFSCLNKSKKYSTIYKTEGGYSSIGRTTVCGTVRSLFESGYPPYKLICIQIKNENCKTY